MATAATTRIDQETAFTPPFFLAFELGVNKWKLGCTTGAAQRPRERQVPAGDCQTVLEEIRRAKSRFGLPAEAQVVSCYEAGRDGSPPAAGPVQPVCPRAPLGCRPRWRGRRAG
jgi:hypothetical protein